MKTVRNFLFAITISASTWALASEACVGPGACGPRVPEYRWSLPSRAIYGYVDALNLGYLNYAQPTARCDASKSGSTMALDLGHEVRSIICTDINNSDPAALIEKLKSIKPDASKAEIAATRAIYKWEIIEQTPIANNEMRLCDGGGFGSCDSANLGKTFGKTPCNVVKCVRVDGTPVKDTAASSTKEMTKDLSAVAPVAPVTTTFGGVGSGRINEAIDNVNRNLEAAKAASEKAAAAEREAATEGAPAKAPEKPYNEKSYSELNPDTHGDGAGGGE